MNKKAPEMVIITVVIIVLVILNVITVVSSQPELGRTAIKKSETFEKEAEEKQEKVVEEGRKWYSRWVREEKEENKKDMSFYKDKPVFLVSDENWQDVLRFVPVAMWNRKRDKYGRWWENGRCNDIYNPKQGINRHICGYPLLIYHKEEENFDADFIILFLEQYKPKKIYVVGNTPQELMNLLSDKFGANGTNIQEIKLDSYIKFWRSYKDVVVVGNNYTNALLASVYAAYLNAPLMFSNNHDVFTGGKNAICIGDVPGFHNLNCDKSYSLNRLRYVLSTKSKRVILVNPNDIKEEYCEENDYETKFNGMLGKSYCKDSMAAPILAVAKHEILIFSETESAPARKVDIEFEEKILMIGDEVKKNVQDLLSKLTGFDRYYGKLLDAVTHFTIIAGPKAIPHLDKYYVDKDGDGVEDFPVSRIFGKSLSTTSTDIAKILFSFSEKENLVSSLINWFSDFLKSFKKSDYV